MQSARIDEIAKPLPPDVDQIDPQITEFDEQAFARITSVELTSEQQDQVVVPPQAYPIQSEILALHWHPEFVPLPLIRERVRATFPNATSELIIPTQHNELESYDGEFTGVEVDCYSPEFNRKTQLLIHFASDRLRDERAEVFKGMLSHTFKYRSSQLHNFFDTLLEPLGEPKLEAAAEETGADSQLVKFVQLHTRKLARWFENNYASLAPTTMKNKLIRDYFNQLREFYNGHYIDRVQIFLREVKTLVKADFNLGYFFETRAVIEEVRSLGGCILIPHPEQFWPILLADYDVDGYEVWNPQSREYTDFLIQVVNRQNRSRARDQRPLLITMGDDCHMGEKVKDRRFWDSEKAHREIGVQPAWDDLAICKTLASANVTRGGVMREYRSRLRG